MAIQHYIAHAEDEESYFISMTDVVIGLLFIFIIMLMFFAMRFQEATQVQSEETQKQSVVTQKQNALIEDLSDAEAARSAILEKIGSFLQKEGIKFVIVKDEGILRLPEEILFDRSSWEVKAHIRGVADPLRTLGRALDQVLPCYTAGARSRQTECPTTKAKVEAIFIEGHADSDQFRSVIPTTVSPAPASPQLPVPGTRNPNEPTPLLNWFSPKEPQNDPPGPADPRRTGSAVRTNGPPKDNLDLSALRATSTFRELLRVQPELSQYLSPHNTPILSVSGYGEYRPVAHEEGETVERFKQRNRRIDLRILMAGVRSEDAKRMQLDIQRFGTHP